MDNNLSDNQQNLLSNLVFRLSIDHTKFSNVEYSITQFVFPDISLGISPSGFKNQNGFVAGDTIDFTPFNLTFMVDEDMKNYLEIFDWIHRNRGQDDLEYHDAIFHIYDNHNNINKEIKFVSCFPTSLGGLDFDVQSTEVTYLKSSVTFQYDYFTFVR